MLGILAVEGLVLGALATLLGIVLGYGLLLWFIRELIPNSYPDLGVILTIHMPQLAVVLAAGIAVVALAPALTVRKLQKNGHTRHPASARIGRLRLTLRVTIEFGVSLLSGISPIPASFPGSLASHSHAGDFDPCQPTIQAVPCLTQYRIRYPPDPS